MANLRFCIPELKLSDSDFGQKFQLLSLKSLKSLDLNIENTGIDKRTMKALTEFIESNNGLESISLMLKDNNLIDISGFFRVISSKNLPKLGILKLYLHRTNLNWKVLRDFGECLASFPEEIAEFKIDLEGNNLANNENKWIFSKIAEGLGNKFKKLKSLQFHMGSCGIGRGEIISFLGEAMKIKAKNTLFFSLGLNRGFWDGEWSENEVEQLKKALLESEISAKSVRIELGGKKSWKENNKGLVKELEFIQNKQKGNKGFTLKF